MKLGTEATPEQIEAERAKLGLDQPLPVRYVWWLRDVLRLDLGRLRVRSVASLALQ